MNHLDLWPLAWGALDALTAHYGPAINHAAEELGIPTGEWYGWLMAAAIFEPDPVSAHSLHIRSAYTAPARLEAALTKGVSLGLLEPAGGGEHRLTAAGRAGVRHLIESAYAVMAKLRPLPQDDLARLAGLLQRGVAACLAMPEPPTKWSLRIERHLDPGVDAPVMERLDQYLSDLAAYRDDCHLTAWRLYDVSGQAWEAFTLLWRGEARTLDDLAGRLAQRRGFTREEYAAALDDLCGRGWVVAEGAGYVVTERGTSLRQEAEATTDRYFYAPWACLSEDETAELRGLLARFREGLG